MADDRGFDCSLGICRHCGEMDGELLKAARHAAVWVLSSGVGDCGGDLFGVGLVALLIAFPEPFSLEKANPLAAAFVYNRVTKLRSRR